MPIRGILSKLVVLSFAGSATDFNNPRRQDLAEDGGPRNALSGAVSRSNSLNQRRDVRILGISPLALSRFAPSWSVEMTAIGSIGESSILMQKAFRGSKKWAQTFPCLGGKR